MPYAKRISKLHDLEQALLWWLEATTPHSIEDLALAHAARDYLGIPTAPAQPTTFVVGTPDNVSVIKKDSADG